MSGDDCERLKDAVTRLLRATTPFTSALEGDPYDLSTDLEELWHELAGLVGYRRDEDGER